MPIRFDAFCGVRRCRRKRGPWLSRNAAAALPELIFNASVIPDGELWKTLSTIPSARDVTMSPVLLVVVPSWEITILRGMETELMYPLNH